MQQESIFILLSLFTAALGIAMLANSITGMMTFDSTVKPVCSYDSDCVSPEVCCLFYNQEAGVCNAPRLCMAITELTKKEMEQQSAFPSAPYGMHHELKGNSLFQTTSDFLILALVLLAVYHYLMQGITKNRKNSNI
jgi:hypothetical protein